MLFETAERTNEYDNHSQFGKKIDKILEFPDRRARFLKQAIAATRVWFGHCVSIREGGHAFSDCFMGSLIDSDTVGAHRDNWKSVPAGHEAAEITKHQLLLDVIVCVPALNASPLAAARLMRRPCVHVIPEQSGDLEQPLIKVNWFLLISFFFPGELNFVDCARCLGVIGL